MEAKVLNSYPGENLMHESLQRRIARYHEFYASDLPGDLLIVNRPSWVTKKNLYEYDFTRDGHLEMAADMLQSARALLAMNGDLDDDFIPWLNVDFGIAIHHTFLYDLPVQFAEWTSWADHPLTGPDGYQKLPELRYQSDNPWVRRVKEVVAYWHAQQDDCCLHATFGHYGPLDLANALRGDELFTDFYEFPEDVHALLRCCTEAIIAFEEELRTVCGERLHSYGAPFWGALAPRGAVFLSEDAMDLCGPNISTAWGLPYSQQIAAHFGAIAVHHHMLGRPVQGVIGQEVRHSLVQISNDPNCPPAMSCLRELYQQAGGNAVMVDCSPQDIADHLDDLREVRAILICCNSDIDAGKRAVEMVRSISNIT